MLIDLDDVGWSHSVAPTRTITKEAYIYGFPIVDDYRVKYAYFVNKQGRLQGWLERNP